MMKAIILENTGGVENLISKEIEQPVAKENEVLVAIKAIGVNPVDFKVRANDMALKKIYGKQQPVILGWDIAGTVVAIGNAVTKFETGDRVFGMVNFPGTGKAYAEFLTSPEDHLAKVPDHISFENAAVTTLAALTALQVLKNSVKKDDRVLVHAGSGGVGHFAIQIAKSLGAYVITTCSSKNRDFVLSLGADEHIDYQTQAFEDILSKIDFVFDMFNGDMMLNSVKVVKEGGFIITISPAEFSDELLKLAKDRRVNVSKLFVHSNGDDMNTLKNLLENNTLHPHVSKTFKFDEMAAAHQHLESGRTVGKVVITL